MIETGSTFWFAPQDDIASEILRVAATETSELCMSMYGWHLPPLCDQFIANHKAGLTQFLLLDLSQSKNNAEHQEVLQVIDAGLDVVIGTSPKHNILHSKYMLSESLLTVLTGSYNFSLSAAVQDNTIQAFTGQQIWQAFRSHFEVARDWCVKNEPQDQIKQTLRSGVLLKTSASRFP